jgi:putative FmdB family regulatory protein
MPLYEYFCGACGMSFEALIAVSAPPHGSHACPECGEDSRRILSPVNFTREAANVVPQPRSVDGNPDVTSLKLPPAARLCWMDNQSAARLAAYKAGRGAEYDDTIAARKELASQRRDAESGKPASPADSRSPLSDPVILANRKAAAQKEKVAESGTITRKQNEG